MEKQKEILWLRSCYWIGAILDLINGIAMVFPSLFITAYNIENTEVTPAIQTSMGLGAALMFGWTFLLIWADRKPVERKDILLLTVFPVIVGIFLTTIYAVTSDFILFENMIITWMIQTFLVIFFLFNYFNAKKLESKKIT